MAQGLSHLRKSRAWKGVGQCEHRTGAPSWLEALDRANRAICSLFETP